jgi:non-canonical (house-cleaning) NTP pyrophosphatase
VHEEDGLDGARRRAAAAARFASGFGVATECGMQNEPREAHPRILEIQRELVVA